jgi:citrate lyase subunit beta-like protein
VESAAQLQWVDEQINRLLGKEKGDGLILIALVESVQGMVRVAEIASAVPHRLRGLIFGADDYRASVGAVKSSTNEEVSFARNLVLLHAKANGLDAIDLVQTNFADPEIVANEARQGVALGYTGKQIIHPKQIEPVQAAFAPDAASVEWARRVEAEAVVQASKGVGAFVVDGLMVDKPLIVKAQQIVAKARLCGMLNDKEEEKGKA